MSDLYKRIPVEEGALTECVGVHVIRWRPEWGEPTYAFIKADEPSEIDKLQHRIAELETKVAIESVQRTESDCGADDLRIRIAYLESLLRWRPVSEKPEENGYYEVEFDYGYGEFHDMVFYNTHDSWRCNQEHVNITGWRPIPELEVKK